MLYDLHETAELVGLSPVTLQNYARPGYSDLVRAIDFVIRRITRGPYLRRMLYFTERGVLRLQARDYRVYTASLRSPSREVGRAVVERMKIHLSETSPAKRPLESYSPQEQRMRLKDIAAQWSRLIGQRLCTNPNCPCPYHEVLKRAGG